MKKTGLRQRRIVSESLKKKVVKDIENKRDLMRRKVVNQQDFPYPLVPFKK